MTCKVVVVGNSGFKVKPEIKLLGSYMKFSGMDNS